LIRRSGHLAILGLVNLQPGDQLLFRAGDVFRGGVHYAGLNGEDGAPITIGRFGDGPRPHLDGAGAFAALWLDNPSHVVVEGLEITNPAGSCGIYLEGRDAGPLRNITIQDVEIHDVFAAGFARHLRALRVHRSRLQVHGRRPRLHQGWWRANVVGRLYRKAVVHPRSRQLRGQHG
ncbi:MAG: right-handed parallel beta-helix repeat-containing protein, partial [Candidatus Poribacteria bacterium]